MFSEMFYKLWNNGLIQLGIWETVYMTLISSAFAYLIGLPLGVILNVTDKKGIAPHPKLNSVLGFVVNFFRSIPCIILMVAMMPVARLILGKSLGNAIYLSDPAEEVRKKVMSAVTDASRIKKDDPGHPDICVVSKYHKVFNAGEYENICESCKKGAIGCVACKKALAASLNDLLEPFREKRAYYEAHRDEVRDIILTGSEKANKIGNETVKEVKEAMHIYIGD